MSQPLQEIILGKHSKYWSIKKSISELQPESLECKYGYYLVQLAQSTKYQVVEVKKFWVINYQKLVYVFLMITNVSSKQQNFVTHSKLLG